jgi:hypothetical protein
MDWIQTLFNKRLGKPIKDFFLQAQTLVASSNLIIFPQHDFLTCKCLFRNLTLGHAREYYRATHALAPFFPTPTFSNTT